MSVLPIYMPGRKRTGSSPSRISISFAVYSLVVFGGSVVAMEEFLPPKGLRSSARQDRLPVAVEGSERSDGVPRSGARMRGDDARIRANHETKGALMDPLS